jgi:protein-L-isoaspartate(D-aspartate) O-methyltransferase
MTNTSLIRELIRSGYLKSPEIIAAFRKIDRRDFVPIELAENAYLNEPLPIGFGQTISQPLTVAFMLELLSPQKGDKVLDIGSGSGWQASLIAEIVGPRGRVYAVERVPELFELGKWNASKYGRKILQFVNIDASAGLPELAPFDRIVAAASAETLPLAWCGQLKPGGKIVAPIKSSVWLFEKNELGGWSEKEFPGFAFVPLIENHGA